MKYIVMLLLLSTCFANATTDIRWDNGQPSSDFVKLDFGTGIYVIAEFEAHYLVNITGVILNLNILPHKEKSAQIVVKVVYWNGARWVGSTNLIKYYVRGWGEVKWPLSVVHHGEDSKNLYLCIIDGGGSTTPEVAVWQDNNGCQGQGHYYRNRVVLPPNTTPITGLKGDLTMGLYHLGISGVNPTSLGRVKALYR